MRHHLDNGQLRIEVEEMGAELRSMKDAAGREYIWQAEPEHWERSSPLLFPIVGRLKEHSYSLEGRRYGLEGHGFAKTSLFELETQTEDSLCFVLRDNEQTRVQYPFAFELRLSYRLSGKELSVQWALLNTDSRCLYFSIGGHPGISTAAFAPSQTACSVYFPDAESDCLEQTPVLPEGIGSEAMKKPLRLKQRRLVLKEGSFAQDALIFEQGQVKRLALCGADGQAFLEAETDAPIMALWSSSSTAPFVCIEPWWGTGDRVDFEGDFSQKDYVMALEPGAQREGGFVLRAVAP